MGKKGSFGERLEAALSVGQTVTITRHEEEEAEDYYQVVTECPTEQFGALQESIVLFVSHTTPGGLVSAIEKTAGKITSAVEVMSRQSTNVAEPVQAPPAEL